MNNLDNYNVDNSLYEPTPSRRSIRKKRERQERIAMLRELLISVIIVVLIKMFLFEIITVDGTSMLETLHSGDKLYVSLLTARLQGYGRGDVVICYYPGREERCVKRVIGLPGETIKVVSGTVYINGEPLEEDYLTYKARYSCPEITLDDGEYFLLGDNRPISHDSHSADVGPVSRIEGEVRFIIWPISRIGSVN